MQLNLSRHLLEWFMKSFVVPLNTFSTLHVSFNTTQSWEGKTFDSCGFSHIYIKAKKNKKTTTNQSIYSHYTFQEHNTQVMPV